MVAVNSQTVPLKPLSNVTSVPSTVRSLLKLMLHRFVGPILNLCCLAFKTKMNNTTAAIQGSGWGWLGYNPETKKLEIVTTANQDPLLTHAPIIGIDIWEHAFYLQYKNVKPDVSGRLVVFRIWLLIV